MTEKKITRVEPTEGAASGTGSEWQPTEAANSKATTWRIVAFMLWLLAIGAELGLIFGVLLAHNGEPFTNGRIALLIGGLVVIALLAIAGSMLWKKANRLDPARKEEKIRFFVQNQLGAIMTLLAFVPLIVLILLNKDMSNGQKAVAGGIGVVLALGATALGIDFNPPSVEQYTAEQNSVIDAVGQDRVYWAKHSKVFHICPEVSDLNRDATDEIFEGTVADAHAAGMERLTKKVEQERKQCGFGESADDEDRELEPTD